MSMIDWILGRNPFSLTMCEGVGTFNPVKYHHRIRSVPGNPFGRVPGAIPNGITRKGDDMDDPILEDDLPYFDLRPAAPVYYEADFSSTEPFIPHNSYFVLVMNSLYDVIS